MKRLLSLILCSTLICGVFTGCGNSDISSKNNVDTVKTDSEMSTVTDSDNSIEETYTETEFESELETEKFYKVSMQSLLDNFVVNFFQNWLDLYVQHHLGYNVTEPDSFKGYLDACQDATRISRPIANTYLSVDADAYDVDSGFSENNYIISSLLHYYGGDNVTYSLTVTPIESNITEFEYYADTFKAVAMMVDVQFNVNGYTDNAYFGLEMKPSKSNPEEWSITEFVHCKQGSDDKWRPQSADIQDLLEIKLVNETETRYLYADMSDEDRILALRFENWLCYRSHNTGYAFNDGKLYVSIWENDKYCATPFCYSEYNDEIYEDTSYPRFVSLHTLADGGILMECADTNIECDENDNLVKVIYDVYVGVEYSDGKEPTYKGYTMIHDVVNDSVYCTDYYSVGFNEDTYITEDEYNEWLSQLPIEKTIFNFKTGENIYPTIVEAMSNAD